MKKINKRKKNKDKYNSIIIFRPNINNKKFINKENSKLIKTTAIIPSDGFVRFKVSSNSLNC